MVRPIKEQGLGHRESSLDCLWLGSFCMHENTIPVSYWNCLTRLPTNNLTALQRADCFCAIDVATSC